MRELIACVLVLTEKETADMVANKDDCEVLHIMVKGL